MADKKTKAHETDAGTLGRLSKAGEDALTKFLDELGKNERVTDALGKASSAKGKLDDSAKRALGGVGLAAAEELRDLRKHVEQLEKRLAKLEAESKPKPKPKAASRAKKTTDKAASPAPGRAIGGGTGRGAGSGGTAAA
jgi:polyhydroxyalkanoate synthesis regulator phasin